MSTSQKNAGQSPTELLDGSGIRVGIAVARFNSDITYKMRDLCLTRLAQLGVKTETTQVFEVPGSFELPLAARVLLDPPIESDAVIALGAVIRGETDHYEHIANAASQGLLRVSEQSFKPVIFGVLTTDTIHQAQARIPHATTYADSAIEIVNRIKSTTQKRTRIGLV